MQGIVHKAWRLDIMEFDRFLRRIEAAEYRYDTTAQPQYNPWENEAKFDLTFTDLDVFTSPNILVFRNGGNTITLQAVRTIDITQTDSSEFRADIKYRGGVRGESLLTIFIRANIIN